MRIPKRLQPLIEEGLIDEVVRPITAGKEAEVFVVWAAGHLRAAKVYKEANQRSFKNRADYLDGRKGRSSRDERALKRGGKHAKEAEEEGWYTQELLALGRLHAAGVRVPEPRGFMDGVLIMDLVLTLEGEPAPRLADCNFTPDEARVLYSELVNEVQRMLCVGIVHGDLSEYNVLLAPYGPVIIDFPQMVDAAASLGARKLLLRDLGNLRTFASRFAPELESTRFGEEMWLLYQSATLTPDTVLTGNWKDSTRTANIENVREAITDAEKDHERQSTRAGRSSGGPQGRPAGRGGPPRGPAPRAANAGPELGTGTSLKTHPRGSVSAQPPAPTKTHPRGSVSEPPRGAAAEQRGGASSGPRTQPPRSHQGAPPHHQARPNHNGPRGSQGGPNQNEPRPQQGPPQQQRPPQGPPQSNQPRPPQGPSQNNQPRPPQNSQPRPPQNNQPRLQQGPPQQNQQSPQGRPQPSNNASHAPRQQDTRPPRAPQPSSGAAGNRPNDARDALPREPRR